MTNRTRRPTAWAIGSLCCDLSRLGCAYSVRIADQAHLGFARSGPVDGAEIPQQPRAARRVNLRNPRNAAKQMLTEHGVRVAILACRPVASAIVQQGLERVELAARNVESAIHHQADNVLRRGLRSCPSLLEMRFEAFVDDLSLIHISEPTRPY